MSIMRFDNDAGESAGVGGGASESGAYKGILMTRMITATTGAKGIEFSLKGDQDVNYMKLYYQKADGTVNPVGYNMINAIMGLVGVNEINAQRMNQNDENGDPIYICRELENKQIGFVVQKVWYTDSNGDDKYKFDIIMPFDHLTMQTLVEKNARQHSTTVDKILSTLKDKDERKPVNNNGYNGSYRDPNTHTGRPQSKFDQVNNNNNSQDMDFDDIPY